MNFDLKRLRLADYVVAGGAVLYLIWALFSWFDFARYYGLPYGRGLESLSGFRSGLVTFSFVLFLIAAAWALLPAVMDVKLGFPRSWVTVGLTGLGLLLTLFAWIKSLRGGFFVFALLGLLTAVAITLFAVLRLLPELRTRPALPGRLGEAAQWANQQAPQFGQQQGQPGQAGRPAAAPYPPPPTAPYGQPPQQHGQPPQPYGQPSEQHGQPPQPYGQPSEQHGQPPQPYGSPSGAPAAPPPPPAAPPEQPPSAGSAGPPTGSTGSTASGSGQSGPGPENSPGTG